MRLVVALIVASSVYACKTSGNDSTTKAFADVQPTKSSACDNLRKWSSTDNSAIAFSMALDQAKSKAEKLDVIKTYAAVTNEGYQMPDVEAEACFLTYRPQEACDNLRKWSSTDNSAIAFSMALDQAKSKAEKLDVIKTYAAATNEGYQMPDVEAEACLSRYTLLKHQ